MLICSPIFRVTWLRKWSVLDFVNNNNNNNDKVYTPLSEKCSQSRVFISQCHIIHIVQYYAYWLVWFM